MEIKKVVRKEPQPDKVVIVYMVDELEFYSLSAAEDYIREVQADKIYMNIPKKTYINREGFHQDWYYVTSMGDIKAIEDSRVIETKGDTCLIKFPAWIGLDIHFRNSRKDVAYIVSFESFKEDMLRGISEDQMFLEEIETFKKEV